MGSDSVVKAYNNLMQYFYNMQEPDAKPSENMLKEMLELLGDFLLEIRKSMGNETTKLENWDMLEWWMSDARKLRNA